MRFGALIFAVLLAACGRNAATGASTTIAAATTTSTASFNAAAPSNAWFICDGIDAPTILVFKQTSPTATTATMIQYDKTARGAAAAPVTYTLGEGDGAAGSLFTPLLLNGQDAGHIRQINEGMLETPGSAYTTVYSSVTLGDKEVECRWMPRTRLIGFSDRRSFVINEDKDGDLIYTTYDFSRPASAPIDISENGHTNTFSAEVRGGSEHASPGGIEFRFEKNGYRYVVTGQTGQAQVQVFHGDQLMQTEPMLAVEYGTAAHGTTP